MSPIDNHELESELESDQEEDVVDCTKQHYDNIVRISNGFSLDQLKKGVMFNPAELDPTNNNQDPDDLVNLLEGVGLVDDDEDAEDQDDFEMKKKGMVDITDARDGGVLKRTMKAGIQSLPAVPEMAVVKIHYSLYLKGVDEPIDCTLLRGKAEKHSIGGGRLLPVSLVYCSWIRETFPISSHILC